MYNAFVPSVTRQYDYQKKRDTQGDPGISRPQLVPNDKQSFVRIDSSSYVAPSPLASMPIPLRRSRSQRQSTSSSQRISTDGSKPLVNIRRESLEKYRSSISSPRVDSACELNYGNRESIHVESCSLNHDDEWIYSMDLKLKDGQSHILQRSYSDLWALHIKLLESCPREAGGNNHPRSIPFLDPLLPHMSTNEAIRRRKVVNFYMQELLKLSQFGVGNSQLDLFLAITSTDFIQKEDHPLFSTASETIMDLLSDLTVRDTVLVKVTHGKYTFAWSENSEVTYTTLFNHTRRRVGEPIYALKYRNEWGEKTPLLSDNELRLLVNFKDRLVLYTS
ncbi:hypothetical protein BC833DRAFT_650807 [Globomyces pollinis-pini]|nr:hypothetical protein BC833DRAFT_650807 [Globomyces pollinis-pini]KAJ2994778.1 hypothetical protein HDV02_001317 [Globomyces sp. JEL0801]